MINLDLPETEGWPLPPIKGVINLKLQSLVTHLRVVLNEVVCSQSSRISDGVLNYDAVRFKTYMNKLKHLTDLYAPTDNETYDDKLERLEKENKYLRKRVTKLEKDLK